jgi:TatD DNase family protein
MIDTHAHIYDPQFDTDRSEMIDRAKAAGIRKIYMPNCDSGTIASMLEMADTHPDYCIPMMGVHPCYIKENFEEELNIAKEWLAKRPFAAVGEIGLDYYWDKTFVQEQKIALNTQMSWALEKNLPVVIHTRDAMRDTIDLVKPFAQKGLQGVFHCFSGSREIAREITQMGFYLGIGGVLTYPKAGLKELAKELPLDWIILETDAPYLTPVPFRGKRNEPSYISYVAQLLADIREMQKDELIAITNNNSSKLFGS